jgi:hypothetical protein
VSPEARGPEKRGATAGAAEARGSRTAGAAGSGSGSAEPRGHRKPDAADAGSQEPVTEASGAGKRVAEVSGAGKRVTEASGAEKRAAQASGSQEPVAEASGAEKRSAQARGSQEAAQASAASGEAGEPGAGEAGGGAVASGTVVDSGEQDEIVVRDPISAPDVDGRPRRVTRRFPLFTRDTAPPEGGGRAAPRDAPAPARQWPVLAVLAVVGLGLLLTALDQFRLGTLLIGVALLAGAVLRWLLPDVGMLAVRSRFTDIATYGVLGAAIVLLALMVQPKPWLEIPFLKDTLHFTVSSS